MKKHETNERVAAKAWKRRRAKGVDALERLRAMLLRSMLRRLNGPALRYPNIFKNCPKML